MDFESGSLTVNAVTFSLTVVLQRVIMQRHLLIYLEICNFAHSTADFENTKITWKVHDLLTY